MSQLSKKLRADRKKIVDEMQVLNANEAMTPEQLVKFDELDKEQEKLKARIDADERSDELAVELNARVERRAIETGRSPTEISNEERDLMSAHNAWMRGGDRRMTDEQRSLLAKRTADLPQNAMSSVDDTAGGYTVPETMANQIIDAEKFEGGMITPGVAFDMTTASGNPLSFPTDNDTNNEGEIINDNTDASNAGAGGPDIKFGNVGFNAHLFSSKFILVPLSLLQDSAFDLNAFIVTKFGQRLGRALNRKFTLGTGASEPKGIITVAPVGRTGAAGQVTSVMTDDLTELEHSVDPAYRQGARFMFADSTLKTIKKLKDGVGRPLWQSGIAVKEPDSINGYSYVINTKMADMAANAKSIAFGQFNKYYIRRAGGIVMLRLAERFAEKGQVGFVAFQRADGNLVDAGTNPVKLYQNPGA